MPKNIHLETKHLFASDDWSNNNKKENERRWRCSALHIFGRKICSAFLFISFFMQTLNLLVCIVWSFSVFHLLSSLPQKRMSENRKQNCEKINNHSHAYREREREWGGGWERREKPPNVTPLVVEFKYIQAAHNHHSMPKSMKKRRRRNK